MAKKAKGTAKTMPMRVLDEKGVRYQVRTHRRKLYTAEDVAEDLGIPLAQSVKAMIVRRPDGSFVLVIIPGDKRLSLKKLGAALKEKGMEFASARDAERVSGFQVGAVSVLGLRRPAIPVYLDEGVLAHEMVIISSGRPDMGLEVKPRDVREATDAEVGDFAS